MQSIHSWENYNPPGNLLAQAEDSDSDADDDYNSSTLPRERAAFHLEGILLELFLTGRLSAKDFCIMCHFMALAGIPELEKYGFRPDAPSGHYTRKVEATVPEMKASAESVYEVEIQGMNKHDVTRSGYTTLVKPVIDDLVKEVFVFSINVFLSYAHSCTLGNSNRSRHVPFKDQASAHPPCKSDSLRAWFVLLFLKHVLQVESDATIWESMSAIANETWIEAYQTHPVVASATDEDKNRILPVAMYLDVVPYSKGDSVLNIFTINLLSGMRHLTYCGRKSDFCSCGCKGWCSIYPIFQVLAWQFTHLQSGCYPSERHDGKEWGNTDELRASMSGKGIGFRGVLLEVRGDWLEFSSRLGFEWCCSGKTFCATIALKQRYETHMSQRCGIWRCVQSTTQRIKALCCHGR